MKRIIIALLLAVCLTMAFALPVFADGHSDFGQDVAIAAQASTGEEAADEAANHPTGPPE